MNYFAPRDRSAPHHGACASHVLAVFVDVRCECYLCARLERSQPGCSVVDRISKWCPKRLCKIVNPMPNCSVVPPANLQKYTSHWNYVCSCAVLILAFFFATT